MEYEWDEDKRRSNLKDHGVDFNDAKDFGWERARIVPDNRCNYGEPRRRAYGYIDDRLMVLIYTPRGQTTRIISLRKANRREVRQYG